MTDPDEKINGTYDRIGEVAQSSGGLTKREHFAIEIFKGRMANPDIHRMHVANAEYVAKDAVMYADSLIAELNKQNATVTPIKGDT